MLLDVKADGYTGTASSSALDAMVRCNKILRPANGVLVIGCDYRKYLHAVLQHNRPYQSRQVVWESGQGVAPGGSEQDFCGELLRQQAMMTWLLRDAFVSTFMSRRDRTLTAISGFGVAQLDIVLHIN